MNVPQKMVFSGKKLAGYIYFDYLCRKNENLSRNEFDVM